jgi:hypothetical protein
LPRRRRARGQRPRTTQQREGEAPPPREARPALPVVAPEEAAAEQAPRRASTGTAAKAASRHIGQDYSYVPSELKRIAITVGVIVVGLVAAAIFLR